MKRYLTQLILLIIALILGVIYGILIQRNQVFPHRYIKTVLNFFYSKQDKPNWSIGVYKGPTPFDLANREDISNPVLTGKDVVDIEGKFVADPFMLVKSGKYFMFFEVMNRKTNQGDIGYAVSSDGVNWKYGKIIIDESFHLSYPYVFEWKNDIYLIPESYQDLSVRVYKALSFPEKWEYIGSILNGYRYLDPSIFRYNDTWWLFVGSGGGILNLYYSDDLLKGWKPHPMNPIVKFDKHCARPGGRVINNDGKLYRFTQDHHPGLGIQVFAFEINELSKNSYVEKKASEKPIVKLTGIGWNAAGMHHVDMHKLGDEWIAVVDGRNR